MPAADLPPVVWTDVIRPAKSDQRTADEKPAKATPPRPIPGPARRSAASTYNLHTSW